jgi:hypothetical protein
MHYLSGFLMTKDENRHLREWVAFHRTQGYTKFYIYDNMSKVPVAETLAWEVGQGLVDVTLWEDDKVGRHHRCMDTFLDRRDVDTVWASLTDTDEFGYGIERPLAEVMKAYEMHEAVKLGWLCFGSSGHDKRPEGLVIESYTKRGSPESILGGKSIVKFGKIRRMGDCHNPKQKHRPPLIDRDRAVINHYITRSKEDWKEKSRRGGGNGSKRGMRLFRNFDAKTNHHEDLRILRYLNVTKELLASIGPV